MALRFRWRYTIPIGPIRLRFSQGRFTGWGIKIGRWTWNARTGQHSVDTPGPGSWTIGAGQRKRRRV